MIGWLIRLCSRTAPPASDRPVWRPDGGERACLKCRHFGGNDINDAADVTGKCWLMFNAEEEYGAPWIDGTGTCSKWTPEARRAPLNLKTAGAKVKYTTPLTHDESKATAARECADRREVQARKLAAKVASQPVKRPRVVPMRERKRA